MNRFIKDFLCAVGCLSALYLLAALALAIAG